MPFVVGNKYSGFTLLEETPIEEVNSIARLFLHEKSGAQLFHLENDDDNKVFSITFRTPPPDNTGLPHILEHSVLCGSRKFPTKEPFVELAKGSLNTFLNAMTYPDKTVYPIASRNDKDFQNLMDVYLDAVFYPNIYLQPETLMQEGWHYELETKDSPLTYKGVVYNEMKGAFSSPEQVLFRKIQESLYPDTPYGVDSGGDPEDIPDLTQEDFLSFHKKYYHPSNSYIYLYGNGPLLDHLKFINDEYLDNFDKITVESALPIQEAFASPRELVVEYPISLEDKTLDKTYLSMNFSVGRSTDPFLYLAFNILEYLLLDNPAAPLKKALLEAGIGKDVFGSYDNSILQPTFSIVAKDTNEDKKEEFQKIILDTLKGLVNDGIEKRLIEAAINFREFKLREANFDGRPKGLIYGIRCMDSWLYDEHPAMHLRYEEALAKVKTALTEPLFEALIEQYLLNNPHYSLLIVTPKPGLAEEKEKEVHEKLKEYKAQLSDLEMDRIIKQAAELKAKQTEPDTPEALATIPMVSIQDIAPKAELLPLDMKNISGVDTLYHPMFTNHIAYVSMLFDTNTVPQALLPYAALLTQVLGEISTKTHHYEELSKEINIHTGGITFNTKAYAFNGKDGQYIPKFIIQSKALVSKLPELMGLLKELVTETLFDDTKRLKEIIQEARSRLEMTIYQQGHIMALQRLSSYFSPAGRYTEEMNGISYYKTLTDLERNFDVKKDEIIQGLQQVSAYIFNKKQLLISIALSEEEYPAFENELGIFVDSLADQPQTVQQYDFQDAAANEGLVTPGKVQYVAKGYSYKRLGYSYTGTLQVLRTITSLDYLWNRVRVQGGAYGAFAQFTRSGSLVFASYRDPNLKETLAVYNGLSRYLTDFEADEREMTKYIIGTISKLDAPLTPPMKGEQATTHYLTGLSHEELQQERDEILGTTSQDIRSLAQMVQDVLNHEYYCVLGSEGKIKENKEMFQKLINVFE